MVETCTARYGPGRAPAPVRTAPKRTAAAFALACAALLGLGPHAAAMGIPATRTDRLLVTYDDGSGQRRTYRLVCDHGEAEMRADPEADPCAHLDRIGGPLPAVAPGQMCSMLYGGPQTATLHGMWRGHRVGEEYRRTNGCEVDRWSRMVPVLPAPGRRVPHAPPLRA
jgi:hypothetical protein